VTPHTGLLVKHDTPQANPGEKRNHSASGGLVLPVYDEHSIGGSSSGPGFCVRQWRREFRLRGDARFRLCIRIGSLNKHSKGLRSDGRDVRGALQCFLVQNELLPARRFISC
jgi:hypothetical protein